MFTNMYKLLNLLSVGLENYNHVNIKLLLRMHSRR